MSVTEKEQELRHLIAKNVRVAMVLEDVGQAHIQQTLKLDKLETRQKLNGSLDFTEEELKVLAAYLSTTVEGFYADGQESTVRPAPPEKSIVEEAKAVKVQEEAIRNVEFIPTHLAVAVDNLQLLIQITEGVELQPLVLKTYMAKLAGKIEDLGYYLRNNIMMRAIQKAKVSGISEEDKLHFVDHYLEKYEFWKEDLVKDVDEVFEVSLSSNDLDAVLAAILPSTKSRLSQWLNSIAKSAADPNEVVDLRVLSAEIGAAVDHLSKSKKILDEYLRVWEK